MAYHSTVLITGGAGFIGSHVVRQFVNHYPEYRIINLDKLTYAGNLENLRGIENASNYEFVKGDITDLEFINKIFQEYKVDGVIHLAAESHVDRSITDPLLFVSTNVIGTANLLNACLSSWQDDFKDKRFYHVSTDEVFGSLPEGGVFNETTPYDPKSPYSASKAGADHLVRAYENTYGLPILITNCSNNYGPFQFPEKLLPLMIQNVRTNKPLPIYGKGENIRDWLYVIDHAVAIDLVYHKGNLGETYNIGGFNEWKNIDIVRLLCKMMDRKLDRAEGTSEKLISFVKDRPGHDLRYAIDASKINDQLGWEPSVSFETGLDLTIEWYLENTTWLDHVTSGSYREYYNTQYQNR